MRTHRPLRRRFALQSKPEHIDANGKNEGAEDFFAPERKSLVMGAAFETLHETGRSTGDKHEHAVSGGVTEHEHDPPEDASITGNNGEQRHKDRRRAWAGKNTGEDAGEKSAKESAAAVFGEYIHFWNDADDIPDLQRHHDHEQSENDMPHGRIGAEEMAHRRSDQAERHEGAGGSTSEGERIKKGALRCFFAEPADVANDQRYARQATGRERGEHASYEREQRAKPGHLADHHDDLIHPSIDHCIQNIHHPFPVRSASL